VTADKGTQACVRLSLEQRLLLLKRFDLPAEFRQQLASATSSRPVDYWLSRDEANNLREQAGDLFQEFGLAHDETVSREGQILEDLIDRFFVG
jgi:hypothetical protein